MPTIFEKLGNVTLRERIAQKIQHAILTGDLHEGERLIERNLAAQFQTSLTAVREALIQLETVGFVIKKPNAATYVTKLSLETAEKIFAVREVLETYAIEEAARLATHEQIRNLEACYLEMVETAMSKNAQEFILKDLGLHKEIWKIANNEYLVLALQRVVDPVFVFTAIRILSRRPYDLVQDARSHLPIIDAIKAKDPQRVRKSFLSSLEEWRSAMRDYVFEGSQAHTAEDGLDTA